MTPHLPRRLALAFAVLALACGAGVHAQPVDIKWGGDGRFSRTLKVPPAKSSEFCGDLKSGRKLLWSFESAQPLSRTLYRLDGGSRTEVEPSATGWTARGKFEAPATGRYCWAWANPTDKPVELSFDLKPQP